MSNNRNQNSEGHWESHSYSSSAVKIGDNPAHISGREANAEGTFDVRCTKSKMGLIFFSSIFLHG